MGTLELPPQPYRVIPRLSPRHLPSVGRNAATDASPSVAGAARTRLETDGMLPARWLKRMEEGKNMLITVGSLTRHADGCLTGVLRTLTIRTQIELRPASGLEAVADYEVLIGSGFVAGYATIAGVCIEVAVLSLEFPAPVRLRAVPVTPDAADWRLEWDASQRPTPCPPIG